MRLVYAIPHWFASHADCATTGICALTILGGHPRVFYSGVRLGAFESYLTAAGFLVFGVSDTALSVGPIVANSLALVVFGLFARETLGQREALLALLFFAIPSPAYMFWTALPFSWGETMLFSAAALWLSARIVRTRERGWQAFGFGLATGLGWWNCILTLAVTAPAFLWIVIRRPEVVKRTRFLALCLAGVLLGALPWIAFNVRYPLESFRRNFAVNPAIDVLDNARDFVVYKLPELTVAQDPIDESLRPYPASFAVGIALSAIYILAAAAFAAGLARKRLRRRRPSGETAKDTGPEMLLFTIVAATAALNVFSGAGSVRGLTVRYALPVYFAVVMALTRLCRLVSRRTRLIGVAAAALVLTFNLGSYLWPWRAQRREWRRREDEAHRLVAFLHRQGIRYVVGDFWDAYPVNFLSKLEIKGIVTDPGQDVYHLDLTLAPAPLRAALVSSDLDRLRRVVRRVGVEGETFEIGPTSNVFVPGPNPPSGSPPSAFIERARAAFFSLGLSG